MLPAGATSLLLFLKHVKHHRGNVFLLFFTSRQQATGIGHASLLPCCDCFISSDFFSYFLTGSVELPVPSSSSPHWWKQRFPRFPRIFLHDRHSNSSSVAYMQTYLAKEKKFETSRKKLFLLSYTFSKHLIFYSVDEEWTSCPMCSNSTAVGI